MRKLVRSYDGRGEVGGGEGRGFSSSGDSV